MSRGSSNCLGWRPRGRGAGSQAQTRHPPAWLVDCNPASDSQTGGHVPTDGPSRDALVMVGRVARLGAPPIALSRGRPASPTALPCRELSGHNGSRRVAFGALARRTATPMANWPDRQTEQRRRQPRVTRRGGDRCAAKTRFCWTVPGPVGNTSRPSPPNDSSTLELTQLMRRRSPRGPRSTGDESRLPIEAPGVPGRALARRRRRSALWGNEAKVAFSEVPGSRGSQAAPRGRRIAPRCDAPTVRLRLGLARSPRCWLSPPIPRRPRPPSGIFVGGGLSKLTAPDGITMGKHEIRRPGWISKHTPHVRRGGGRCSGTWASTAVLAPEAGRR